MTPPCLPVGIPGLLRLDPGRPITFNTFRRKDGTARIYFAGEYLFTCRNMRVAHEFVSRELDRLLGGVYGSGTDVVAGNASQPR